MKVDYPQYAKCICKIYCQLSYDWINRIKSRIKGLVLLRDYAIQSDLATTSMVCTLNYATLEAILHRTDEIKMGNQFFKNLPGLSPFARQLVTHVLRGIDNSSESKAKFKAGRTKYFSLSQIF